MLKAWKSCSIHCLRLLWKRYFKDMQPRFQNLSTHSLLTEWTRKQLSRNMKRELQKRTVLHFFLQVLFHVTDASTTFNIFFRIYITATTFWVTVESIWFFCVLKSNFLGSQSDKHCFPFSAAGAEQESLLQRTTTSTNRFTDVRTAQKTRKCSKCKKPGHNRRNCPGTWMSYYECYLN